MLICVSYSMMNPILLQLYIAIALPKLPAVGTKKQFLAIGDSEGSLYVLVLPRFYAKPQPTEDMTMTELMQREEKRMHDWVADQETRMEKLEAVNAAWKASMKPVGIMQTKDPIETNLLLVSKGTFLQTNDLYIKYDIMLNNMHSVMSKCVFPSILENSKRIGRRRNKSRRKIRKGIFGIFRIRSQDCDQTKA